MTGFGKAEGTLSSRRFSVELRTVNGRFLELNLRLPREFSSLEGKVRMRLQERLQRGSVQCSVQLAGDAASAVGARSLDEAQAALYLGFQETLLAKYGSQLAPMGVHGLLTLPGVLRNDETEMDDEALWAVLEPVLDAAIEKTSAHRAAEGENLRKELLFRLDRLGKFLDEVEKMLPERLVSAKERLNKSVAELMGSHAPDGERMEQEIALMVDKLDVTEEIVRFRSHNALFAKTIDSEGPHGKKLGFLLQEMGREANTLGTKSLYAPMQHVAISLKEELEILREQTMNVE